MFRYPIKCVGGGRIGTGYTVIHTCIALPLKQSPDSATGYTCRLTIMGLAITFSPAGLYFMYIKYGVNKVSKYCAAI